MKTKEDYQAFADELKALCDKHNVDVFGTDFCEGTMGEIALVDREDEASFSRYTPSYILDNYRYGLEDTREYCLRAKRKE